MTPGRGSRLFALSVPAGLVVLFAGLVAAGPAPPADPAPAVPIPAFSRLYRTGCSTCHAAFPKLNPLGEAFRLNGYRFPDNDQLLRDQEPVPLGAEAWKDLWPRAIWPGELPATPPLSLRIVNDVELTRDETEPSAWTYRFPAEVHLPAAGSLGGGVGFLAEVDWTPESDVEVVQAKVAFQDLLPFLPDRALDLRVGKQALHLLTFADPEIDRAARVPPLWTEFDPTASTDGDGSGAREPRLGDSQPTLELDGIVARRTFWSVGLAQGSTDLGADDNGSKDFYYKLRYKLGGLAFDGTYDRGGAPVVGRGGQLFDHALVLEHFGYVGRSRVENDRQEDRRVFGAAARWLDGPLDLGVGAIRGRNANPRGLDPVRAVTWWSAFAKAEWFAWPWLIGSLKAETLRTRVEGPPAEGLEPRNTTRVLPGVVALVHQNVRAVLEAELYAHDATSGEVGSRKPHRLWMRLDLAF